MTVAVRLVDMGGGWNTEAERSALEAGTASSISDSSAKNTEQDARLDTLEAEKIGPPWTLDPTSGDLYPVEHNADTPGIGTVDNPCGHLAIGPAGAAGMEGFLYPRDPAAGGGLAVVGLAGADPENPPPSPVQGNAMLVLNGAAVLVATGGLWIEVSTPITEDHEVIFGASSALPDGRNFAPILVGPEKVYTFREYEEDAADHNVLDLGETEIVSMTLVNSYAANVSTFGFSIELENLGGKNTIFDVILKIDAVEVGRTSRTINNASVVVSENTILSNALTAGQIISLDVDAVGTHGQSQGWVRGAPPKPPTSIDIQQG